MSYLSNVSKGVQDFSQFLIAYGPEAVGKTTFAYHSGKNVLFLDLEAGSKFLDTSRIKIESFDQMMGILEELLSGKHNYDSVAIDSVDHFESLLWEQVCADKSKGGKKVTNIEDFGYGKGYVIALSYWDRFLQLCKKLVEQKVCNVVLICHSHVRKYEDPEGEAYDRYELKLNHKASSLLKETVDTVLFLNFKVHTKTNDNGKTKAFSTGERVMFTERRAAFDAKNRSSLPFEIPLSWDAYMEAVESRKQLSSEVLIQEIQDMLKGIQDESTKKSINEFVSKNKDNKTKLQQAHQRITTMRTLNS
ncbi:MAG: ATP-binding protein [Bacteriovoracaceae bacterium]